MLESPRRCRPGHDVLPSFHDLDHTVYCMMGPNSFEVDRRTQRAVGRGVMHVGVTTQGEGGWSRKAHTGLSPSVCLSLGYYRQKAATTLPPTATKVTEDK